MIEEFLKSLPGWIDELNELTIIGFLGLVVVWAIVGELGRFGYKRKLKKIAAKAIGLNANDEAVGDSTLSGKVLPNPHVSSDQILDFVVEELNAVKATQARNFGELKGEIGELRGEIKVLLSRPNAP